MISSRLAPDACCISSFHVKVCANPLTCIFANSLRRPAAFLHSLDKLNLCRQRLQQLLFGLMSKKNDPLYKHRRTLLTRIAYLTKRQRERGEVLWQVDELMVIVQMTWVIYQDIIAAYAHPKRSEGRKIMVKVMNSIRKGLPKGLEELAQLGRTLWRSREDILAYS